MSLHFTQQMRERFSDREEWSEDQVYEEYEKTLSVNRADLRSLFNLIEIEFGIPIGLLRPNDDMTLVFASVHSRNPLRWIAYKTRASDAKSELNYQLHQRIRKFGTENMWNSIPTLKDLVKAWCGKLPNS